MIKAYVLFGDERLMDMFWNSHRAVKRYVHKRPWYLPVDMLTGQTTSLGYCSLGAFWPGMQVLVGDIDEAIETTRAHYSVWRRYGCLPEAYQVWTRRPVTGQVNYPLRPELIESVFMLHWATNDSSWIGVAMSMMHSLETLTRVECGFARIQHVGTHAKEDLQDSFLLSETLKYLYLIFDSEHWVRSGKFVLSTEAHPLLIRAEPPPGVEVDRNLAGPLVDRSGRIRSHGGSRGAKDYNSARHARKCPRRASAILRSACGFGMPGTDYPVFNITDVQAFTIAEDVREMVQQRMKPGKPALRVGEVFFGEEQSYRVVRIYQEEVMLASLDNEEAQLAKQSQLEAEVTAAYAHLLRELARPGITPNIPFAKLLAVSQRWHGNNMCGKYFDV